MSRRILCVIPMRAGSTGLKDKNIKSLCGKPLFAYMAKKALSISRFEVCMVSTDSKHYASLARSEGLGVPFYRPNNLSDSSTRLHYVLQHALHHFDKKGDHFDAVISCQATAPLLSIAVLNKMVKIFDETGCMAVGTGSWIVQGHPYLAKTLDAGTGIAQDYLRLPEGSARYPRQVRPDLCFFNGAAFLRDRSLLDDVHDETNCLGLEPRMVMVEGFEGLNIDNEFDFALAEFLTKKDERK